MISVQPIQLKKYLAIQNKKNEPSIPHKFYISWEDALWDVVKSFGISNGSIILVPSFFCIDVMQNMKDHGLVPRYYEVDDNLQPEAQRLLKVIDQEKPTFLVLFHAVGIQNDCVNKDFIQSLPPDLIIIEDCVHRITNPSEIELFAPNHIAINSFRKVVPLQGSLLFGRQQFIKKLNGASHSTMIYSWSIVFLWYAMQVFLTLQKVIKESFISRIFGILGEKAMLVGYDIIGDEVHAGYCPSFFKKMYFHLDFDHIKEYKRTQVAEYEAHLAHTSYFQVPSMTDQDKSEIRGFPIIVEKKKAQKIISYCRSNGLLLRPELDDSKWTKKRSIMYLPLGPHVEIEDIKKISTIFNRAVRSAHNTSPTYIMSINL